jgi:signal transduction histidine kinase/CheY-like chemotaxis protein/HPt (histidine-containing phosphotransfer) domain-containing protein
MKLKTVISADRSQLFFIFAAFAMMVVCSYLFAGEIIEKHITLNAERLLDMGESTVHNSLREIEVALLGLEAGIQRRLTGGDPRAQVSEYLLEAMNRLTQSEFGIHGILNFYAYIGSPILVRNVWAPYVASERPWGLAAERVGEFIFSSPSLDKQANITSISVMKAFYRTDETGKEEIGIVGMDIDISWLCEYIKTFMSKDGGYGMLLDRDFKFAVHPDSNALCRRLDKISKEHENILRRLEAGQKYVPSAKLVNASGQAVMAFFRRLENGWFFGIAIPTAVYYEDLRHMSGILSILGLVFMLVLSGFLLRLSAAKMRSDEENKSKSSFLARMSHEIRTPMNSILGMSELIMRHDISKDIREYVSVINQAGLNLLGIINDILDFSKVESGRMTVESKEYSFRRMLHDLISVARLWFTGKPIVFLVNADANIPDELLGDDIRIRQVLTNLLSNAVKYTRSGFVSLDVRMESLDARRIRLLFSVEDSGVGIKEEDMGKLFLDFSRLTTDYTRKVEGTGLGLVIAKMLCHLMGGEIAVSSEYGRGSVFTAVIVQEIVRSGGKGMEKLAVVKDAARKRLLLYEENPFCARSILRTMRELGMKAEEAPSLEDFIGKLRSGGCDRAFVSSRYAETCLSALEGSDLPKRLVVMMEVDEMYTFDKIESLMTPVYCVPMADVLNGVARDGYESAGKFTVRFKAPAAKVLIVDDMQTNLKVAAGLMSIYGMDIHVAGSAFEAFELLKNNVYDVVFMDHMMPKMDGLQATGVIREMGRGDPYYRNLPIIALTANALSGQQEMFLRAGMNDFLAKPIEVKKLDAILRKWIPAEKQAEISEPGLQARRPAEPKASKEPNVPKEPELLKAPGGSGAFTIPGVDCAQGIHLSGDSVDVYKDILSSFCAEADEMAAEIRKCLDSNDVKTYTILVHALKGASRGIGAREFGEIAFRLETYAKEQNVTEIRSGTDELLEKLSVLTGDIRSALMHINFSRER